VAPNLRFLVWTANRVAAPKQLRRLYLRSNENDLYSMGYVQDVEAIDYEAWYPMTSLHYRDATLPVRVNATAFSPSCRAKPANSATPGFSYCLHAGKHVQGNGADSLLSGAGQSGGLDPGEPPACHTLRRDGTSTSLFLHTEAQPEQKSDLGSLCLSVSGGDHSWISGTFRQFTCPECAVGARRG